MVVHGLANTMGVTLEMMILHGLAVMRGSSKALVAVDLPFGSYERSPEQAYESAARLLQLTACQAVEVEAGGGVAASIEFMVSRGIPVIGHVGLRPQAIHLDGGFKAKGRTESERARALAEALAVEAAGAFAIVVEGVANDIADEITSSVHVPTIGIGASKNCDGQVPVTDDMLGLFDWTPKFVRKYADLRGTIDQAARQFASDVRQGRFPADAELYRLRAGN
jgi:3-methyl-2-oxobutanoate hydroxymethyltransferase